MNLKKFIVGGILGGLVDWVLGWLFYGMIFKNTFPMNDSTMNMVMITAGCFTFGFFISYLFTGLTSISNLTTGLKAGAIIGLFQGLFSGFFANQSTLTPNYRVLAIGVVISIVMTAAIGATVATVNKKMK